MNTPRQRRSSTAPSPSKHDFTRPNRRQVIKGALASLVIIGFDPLHRTWLTAEASGPADFQDVPPLDGVLLLDDASRAADSVDKGNIVSRLPGGVLQPGSVHDISVMIQYCRKRGIRVSSRGQAHTTHGQGLCDGLVIEMQHLNAIHSIGTATADVDTGARWMDLTNAAYAQKLTPPVLTGYTQLTIGGTLSVGGIAGLVGGLDTGFQVDTVRTLQIVTGTGDIVECSPFRKPDLFDAALGGLGQCGIITRATLDLIPAKERARTYQLHYTDNATFFRDFRLLLGRPGLNHLYTLWFPPGSTSTVYQLQATVFYDLLSPPNDLFQMQGLSVAPVIQDQPYLDYVYFVDHTIGAFQTTMNWDRQAKPWFDVFLPDSKVEQYVAEVVPALTHRDIGGMGFMLIFPTRRSKHLRSFPRLSNPDGSDWAFLFDILTVGDATTADDPTFVPEMLARNDRLFARARDYFGGVRYPIGSMTFNQADWIAHFGDRWPAFSKAKKKYDPDNILTPGPGIF